MSFLTRDRVNLIAAGALAAALSAGAFIASTADANAAPPGQEAPAFKELDTAGKPVQLSDFAGKTVVLEWTNNGCPFVKKHYESGNMQKTQAAAVSDPNTVWISVISSAPGKQGYVSGAEADRLTTSRGAKPTAVLLDADGSMGKAYGAKTTPHIFVIKDGKIAYNGAIDSIQSTNQKDIAKAANYAAGALINIKAGKEPDPALTVPYGCDVKY